MGQREGISGFDSQTLKEFPGNPAQEWAERGEPGGNRERRGGEKENFQKLIEAHFGLMLT